MKLSHAISTAPISEEITQAFYGFPKDDGSAPHCFVPLDSLENGYTRWEVWCVAPTGNPWVDEIVGAQYADQVIAYARKHRTPGIVSYVQAQIVMRLANGELELTGVESGFLNRIARLSYRAAHN